MGKKRKRYNRAAISLKGITYQRLKDHCVENGITMSSFIERLVAEKIGQPTDQDCRKFDEVVAKRERRAQENRPNDNFDDYVNPITFL